jgi:hypothetical protein
LFFRRDDVKSGPFVISWKGLAILKRSSLVSFFLALTTVAVGVRIYFLWYGGGGELAVPRRSAPIGSGAEIKVDNAQLPIIGTKTIVTRNLFDPERGAGAAGDVEADSQSAQRVRGLVLLGTAILGSNSYAIFQEPSGAGTARQRAPGTLRFKVGDTVDGFNLAEIRERNVVFRKGGAKVELGLDYLRKIDVPAPAPRSIARPGVPSQPGVSGQVGPAAPRVSPQSPRRERLPAPPSA